MMLRDLRLNCLAVPWDKCWLLLKRLKWLEKIYQSALTLSFSEIL
jgi:hypothetical protein